MQLFGRLRAPHRQINVQMQKVIRRLQAGDVTRRKKKITTARIEQRAEDASSSRRRPLSQVVTRPLCRALGKKQKAN